MDEAERAFEQVIASTIWTLTTTWEGSIFAATAETRQTESPTGSKVASQLL
jgi:hypothetical protein